MISQGNLRFSEDQRRGSGRREWRSIWEGESEDKVRSKVGPICFSFVLALDLKVFEWIFRYGSSLVFLQKVAHIKEILSKQGVKIAKQAEEHERFINKVFAQWMFFVLCPSWYVARLVFDIMPLYWFKVFNLSYDFFFFFWWMSCENSSLVIGLSSLWCSCFGAFCFILGASE